MTHMYLRLNSLQPRTEEWIKRSWKEGNWSPNAVINVDGELVDARLRAVYGQRPLLEILLGVFPFYMLTTRTTRSWRAKFSVRPL